ncbi:TPR-like protein, partial [Piedraia hortae CBS 480.64]
DTQPPPPPPHKAPDAEEFKAAGNKLYAAGQYDQAAQEYTRAIAADPGSSTYLSNRAAAYMAAGRWTDALEDCISASHLSPNNPKILHRLAKIHTSLGRPQDALEIYASMTPPATAKDRAAALQMQAHITQAEENLRTGTGGSLALHALDQAEKGLASSVPPPRKWRLMRGNAYLKMNNINSLGSAQSISTDLLRLNPTDAEALLLRGRALSAQGENEKAITHFRSALSYDPDFREAALLLRKIQTLERKKEEGNRLFKTGRFENAIEAYNAALEADEGNKPTAAKILRNRAMAAAKLGRFEEAISDCDRALVFDPGYVNAARTRAKILGESGDWEGAVRAYQALVADAPGDVALARELRNAELELKKSKRKDYYKILGVGKNASKEEIKKAYRRLAVVHHPDKNPGDAAAEERFKDLQEASETLLDEGRRARYDSGEDLMEGPAGMGGFGGGSAGAGVQVDPEVLFRMMNGGGFRFGGRGFEF